MRSARACHHQLIGSDVLVLQLRRSCCRPRGPAVRLEGTNNCSARMYSGSGPNIENAHRTDQHSSMEPPTDRACRPRKGNVALARVSQERRPLPTTLPLEEVKRRPPQVYFFENPDAVFVWWAPCWATTFTAAVPGLQCSRNAEGHPP